MLGKFSLCNKKLNSLDPEQVETLVAHTLEGLQRNCIDKINLYITHHPSHNSLVCGENAA